MKLVKLKPKGRIVFIGDTHGEYKTSKKIADKYLVPGTKMVLLGDYVDRGKESAKNANFLLGLRKRNPKQAYLTQGNHENFRLKPYSPADFWFNLDVSSERRYGELFAQLPYAISVDGVIALHAALPDVTSLSAIEDIQPLDKNWCALLWADFVESSSSALQLSGGIRPKYTKKYFDLIMKRLRKQVLIRSHDPEAPLKMFDNRCLTLFTSDTYASFRTKKTIAIADFSRTPRIKTVDDLFIEEI